MVHNDPDRPYVTGSSVDDWHRPSPDWQQPAAIKKNEQALAGELPARRVNERQTVV